MKIEFDLDKSDKNEQERSLPFTRVVDFEWESAVILPDNRQAYGENRFCAIGYIEKRLHHLVFTIRAKAIRVISLRKANKREVSRYAET